MATTSFDRRFDRWMQDPDFAESYKLHRARIDAIDAVMRAIDDEAEEAVKMPLDSGPGIALVDDAETLARITVVR